MAPRRVRCARAVGAASQNSYNGFTPAIHLFVTGLQPFSEKSLTAIVFKEFQIGLYGVVEADWELFCNSWSEGFLGERLYAPFIGCRWPGTLSASLVCAVDFPSREGRQALARHVWREGGLEVMAFDSADGAASWVASAAQQRSLSLRVATSMRTTERAVRARAGRECRVFDVAPVADQDGLVALISMCKTSVFLKCFSTTEMARSVPPALRLPTGARPIRVGSDRASSGAVLTASRV